MDKSAVRDAATVIVLRHGDAGASVLMGQRASSAAFMPDKYVFPGGAVDVGDEAVDVGLNASTREILAQHSCRAPQALAAAAIRELWEETGQVLGRRAPWHDAPQGWRGFAATGHVPDASALEFVFRAVTPRGNPRRFDARFFLADGAHLASNPDDFSQAEDKLRHLHWVPLHDARDLDLPFITQVVLAEIQARQLRGAPASVPFFRNDDEAHLVTRLSGQSPLGQQDQSED